jgi:hypothetical protein
MTSGRLVEARVLDSWQMYQDALVRTVAPLTEAQLGSRLMPGVRSVGEMAEHIVRGRALHVHKALGGAAAELGPLMNWDEPDDPPRNAAEIVAGLEITWRYITACVARWSALGDPFPPEEAAKLDIVWGMLDHDLPHAGELSLQMGALGLEGPEI